MQKYDLIYVFISILRKFLIKMKQSIFDYERTIHVYIYINT